MRFLARLEDPSKIASVPRTPLMIAGLAKSWEAPSLAERYDYDTALTAAPSAPALH